MSEHTALPWRTGGYKSPKPNDDGLYGVRICADGDNGFEFRVAMCAAHPGIDRTTARANAALIVEAINNYAALKEQIAWWEEQSRQQAARIEELEDAVRRADKYLDDMGYSEQMRARRPLLAALKPKDTA